MYRGGESLSWGRGDSLHLLNLIFVHLLLLLLLVLGVQFQLFGCRSK